ncbi:MAG: DUF2520 domain-containing protein [Clostridia bacterium]|nr:DUF2520 domain-containing protein [Clostridia bacterium]
MKIGIVGAGRLATGLVQLLFRVDSRSTEALEIVGIYNRTKTNAHVLADAEKLQLLSIPQLVDKSDIIFILTSDKAIGEIAAKLANGAIEDRGNNSSEKKRPKTVVHCSGLLTSHVLAPLAAQGWQTVSLHPLQSVTGKIDAAQALRDCWYTVEGDQGGVELVTKLVNSFSANIMTIQPEQKRLYHAAACVASNFLTTLVKMAVDLMVAAGFDEKIGQEALWPLLQGTLANIKELGPTQALTGPIARGDWATVEAHLAKLDKINFDYSELYRALAKFTGDMALNKGNITNEQQQYLINNLLGGPK